MSDKTIKLRYKGSPIEVQIQASVKPEDLYGKQKKTIEANGKTLEKVLVTPWGEIVKPNAFTINRTDSEGTLTGNPIPCLKEDRSPLPILPSSFKTTRLLEDTTQTELLNLKVRAVIPIQTTLPEGLYKTQYNYRDSATLELAILNITPHESFLLIGDPTSPPFLEKEETYNFFEEEENENSEEDLSFSMF